MSMITSTYVKSGFEQRPVPMCVQVANVDFLECNIVCLVFYFFEESEYDVFDWLLFEMIKCHVVNTYVTVK